MTTAGYRAASDRALAFLERTMLRAGFKEEGHDDVAYFFKAPSAFWAAGKAAEAEAAWHLMEPYLERGGRGSANEAYSLQYPMYPWFWMARAAKALGRTDVLEAIDRSLQPYLHPTLGGATVKQPCAPEGGNTVDFFMTSAVGQIRLLIDRDVKTAATLGDTLLRFIAAQAQGSMRFYLRMNDSGDFITVVPAGEPDVFHWVEQGTDGQMFFMLGLPMMHLTQLYERTGENKYLEGAEWLLTFAAGCGDSLYASPMAHKVARGASMLAKKTGNAEARAMALRIADHLASLQQSSGNFSPDVDSMDGYDQTAELALWLREIHDELLQ